MTTAAELDALIDELIVGAAVEMLGVDCGPDARTGLTALVLCDGVKHVVALADLTFAPGSEVGVVVAAYRRWQGRRARRWRPSWRTGDWTLGQITLTQWWPHLRADRGGTPSGWPC